VGGGDGVGPGFPFRGRGLALPARWPPRPPFGFGDATLVGFRSLVGLSVRRVRPYRLLRPSSSLGSGRFHRRPVSGSCGQWNDTCFVPSRTLRSSPSYRAASNFRPTARPCRVAAPSGNVHRAVSRPSPRPPLFGFCPLRRFRPVRRRLGCHASAPAPAGFPDPHGALSSASDLPGVFRPGPSLGFLPSGLLPRAESRTSLDVRRPSCRFPRGSRTPRAPRLQGVSPDEAVTRSGLFVGTGPLPSWVFCLSRVFNQPVSPLSRPPSQTFRPAV